MSREPGLRRQIILSMTLMTLICILICVVGTYLFYTLLFEFAPGIISDSLIPSGIELAWIATSTLVAVVVTVVAAFRLSGRILTPLNSVAQNLRLVAQGDLAARAIMDAHSTGEVAQLVSDFNTMAARLERMARERAFWNAAIAHELRTPVTILRGRLQGLLEGVFEPEHGLFSSLLIQVDSLSRLIEDLRVLGLDENGHLELCLEQIDLADEIRSLAKTVELSLQDAGFTFSLDLEPGDVVCDPVRIRQALLALLENAQQHATPGPLRVQLRLDHGDCRVRVEDCGPGVPSERVCHIFEAFQKGDSSRGSGLGLAVVQAIARTHGGGARYLPSTHGGSIFELSWPAG